MTVRDLITELQKLPPDCRVLVGEAANDAGLTEATTAFVRGKDGSFDWSGPEYAGCVEIS